MTEIIPVAPIITGITLVLKLLLLLLLLLLLYDMDVSVTGISSWYFS